MAFRSLPVGLLALTLQICGAHELVRRDACSNNCSVTAQPPVSYTWAPYKIKETITAATLIVVVNTVYNTTSTSLKLADLPSGYTTPNVNAEGTHVETVSYTRSGKLETTVVAFPTVFVALGDGYSWNGTLATSILGHFANGSCVTQTGSMMSLPFPSYPQPSVTTTATHPDLGPDPEGIYWKPTTEPGVYSDYKTLYPDIGAWQTCSFPQIPLPMEVPFTAKFMTATMTQYDGSKSSEAPQATSTPDTPAASATASKTNDAPEVTNQPASSTKQGPVFVTLSDSRDDDPEPSNTQDSNNDATKTQENDTPAATVVTLHGSAVTVAPGQTFVMTRDGTAVTVAPQTKTQNNDAPAATIVTHEGSAVTIIPGQTFIMTQDGTAITVAPGTKSQNNNQPAETVVTHDGSAVTVAPGQTFVMTRDGSAVTIAPQSKTQNNNAPAETVVTNDGTAVTVAPGETFVMTQDGTPVTIAPEPTTTGDEEILGLPIGTSKTLLYSVGESTTIIELPDGQTLHPGSTATVDGTPVYIPTTMSGASGIVVGSATVTFPSDSDSTSSSSPNPPSSSTSSSASGTKITVGSDTISVSQLPSSAGVVMTVTIVLEAGGSTTVDATRFSLYPSATSIMLSASSTSGYALSPPDLTTLAFASDKIPISWTSGVAAAATTVPARLARRTGDAPSIVIPHSMTLAPGSSITISGTVISVVPSGTALVVGGSTVDLESPSSSTTQGAGNYIWNGLGGGKDSASTGGAPEWQRGSPGWWVGILGSVMLLSY